MELENDFFPAHLNEWIDIIFGHKQQGQMVVKDFNVIHHLFNEGTVNIQEIDDSLKQTLLLLS
jgi:hypothetical protein